MAASDLDTAVHIFIEGNHPILVWPLNITHAHRTEASAENKSEGRRVHPYKKKRIHPYRFAEKGGDSNGAYRRTV